MRPNYILGISAFYHDSAAALLRDGEIIAAAQEERFTRIKHDAAYPEHAVNFCLAQAGISADQISHVIFYEKPLLKFERLLETYLSFAPKGFSSFRKAIPLWISEKLFQKTLLLEKMSELSADIDWNSRYLFSEHHPRHTHYRRQQNRY
jgi:carbamoyltransferase